jgi:hypothetical protein
VKVLQTHNHPTPSPQLNAVLQELMESVQAVLYWLRCSQMPSGRRGAAACNGKRRSLPCLAVASSHRTNHSGGLPSCGVGGHPTTPRRTTQTASSVGKGALAVEPLRVETRPKPQRGCPHNDDNEPQLPPYRDAVVCRVCAGRECQVDCGGNFHDTEYGAIIVL